MKSADGVADITVAAGGRGIYCVVNKKGYNMRYGFNGRTNGSIILPDGKSSPIQNVMTYVEWGRTVMSLESGAPSASYQTILTTEGEMKRLRIYRKYYYRF